MTNDHSGPTWYKQKNLKLSGKLKNKTIHYKPNVEIDRLYDDRDGIVVELSRSGSGGSVRTCRLLTKV